ncbi:hypothetical protein RJ640_019022 [Escallonia rubra]|uniref:Uncharacterized protein n=1 Tax=Escallonia rubra TaxID=112253 RepID=A0AA88TZG9_9ASTE|nr:hypothetical protein RJ640_019022 [Escallonia rubra]
MEKAQAEKQGHAAKGNKQQRPVWDCGSSLYDSFELKSFERQLDSAITSSRTLSMPHLSSRQSRPPPPPQKPQSPPKKSSKISRSLQKLLRSVFRPKQQTTTAVFRVEERSRDGFYVVYDRSGGGLSTIPEAPETAALSPEMKSLARRTASDRFTATSIGISCA